MRYFSPETIDFLWGIRFNNERNWFEAHKEQYKRTLYEPMKALGTALFAPFAKSPELILKVSRIYRDARLHHPLPYKESLWLCIRKEADWWSEQPSLFFELTPERYSYGFLLWGPKPNTMERFRTEIAAKPDCFLSLAEQIERQDGITIGGMTYKRPKPCPDVRIERFFRLKNITAYRECPIDEVLFSDALEARVADLFSGLRPLWDFLLSCTEQQER